MKTFGVMYIMFFGTAVFLKSGNAIQCYECGFFESKCKDPFDSSGVDKISCVGSCSKIKGEGSGEQAVVRGCGIGTENKCVEETYNGIKSQVCFCSGDLCNGALPVAGSFVFLVASIVIYHALF